MVQEVKICLHLKKFTTWLLVLSSPEKDLVFSYIPGATRGTFSNIYDGAFCEAILAELSAMDVWLSPKHASDW